LVLYNFLSLTRRAEKRCKELEQEQEQERDNSKRLQVGHQQMWQHYLAV
jgi:hypothetical protein